MLCEICYLPIKDQPQEVHIRATEQTLRCCEDCATEVTETFDAMCIPERRLGTERSPYKVERL